ncbi:MAG TPA: dihydropteroate synthase [Desulfurivibrio alkaliphilus]|uniref:Dihydropteroate synthase n=1 Tax=Desulfurivibrio alkaliphilus TaxID=427923 RepID=A0A7C2XPZ6_9BACT|nr:dihydropteroate synthase [Desulfurivibrio alkaliphilus]
MGTPSSKAGFLDSSAAPHRTRIMGILNLTPDSFSDGGKLADRETLLDHAEKMLAAGVDILDIGGESTRPMAPPVAVDEELRRVIPAIEAIRKLAPSITISIDTTKAAVARQALAAGADIINDISALRFDPAMAELAAGGDWPVIIMHMQGTPRDMQLNPHYDDVVGEIKQFLARRIEELSQQGVQRERLIIDPGLGFGKTLEHNLAILRNLAQFRTLGRPLLIGHSRKSFLTKLLGELAMEERDLPSAVVAALCALNGADIIRTHNVEATRQALRLAQVWQ